MDPYLDRNLSYCTTDQMMVRGGEKPYLLLMKLLVGLQLHFGYDLTPTTEFESYTDFKK